MELESYFEFSGPDDIRIRGTRVGVEYVLSAYREGASPEEIVLRYPTLSLEQIHAAITYYLRNRAEMGAYLRRWIDNGEAAWQEQQRNPSAFVRDLRKRLEERRRALQVAGARPGLTPAE
jgi:uncharacterized protein (DUF433 family)